MTDTPQIRTELDGRVVKIVVDNVRKKNAFVPEMMVALTEALTEFDRNDEQWVAVLCAAGEHTTAGLDMPKFFGPGASRLAPPADGVDPFALQRRTTKPVVADRAMEIAHQIARNAPLGIRATKEAALRYVAAAEAVAIAAIPEIRARVMSSEDAAEGIRSFLERREARFSGR